MTIGAGRGLLCPLGPGLAVNAPGMFVDGIFMTFLAFHRRGHIFMFAKRSLLVAIDAGESPVHRSFKRFRVK